MTPPTPLDLLRLCRAARQPGCALRITFTTTRGHDQPQRGMTDAWRALADELGAQPMHGQASDRVRHQAFDDIIANMERALQSELFMLSADEAALWRAFAADRDRPDERSITLTLSLLRDCTPADAELLHVSHLTDATLVER